ncbi:MAG: ABC transporter permease, partial [Firmicutes bacterium]|nr:ABC transporter permease [Bacillota bacterium]
MSPWQVIARREFRAVTGGWPYRVVTVVGALLLAALAWTPVLIAPLTGPSVGDGSPARILVAAPWELFQALEGQAAPRTSGAALQLEWIGAELDRAGQTTADARVQDAEIDGWLELVPGPEGLQASLTLATTQRALEPLLRQLVAPVVWTGRARALGVAPEVVAALQQPVPLEVRLLPRVGADPVPRAVREAVSTLLLVGLVMAITLYGNAISMGIIQEKESRVAELLVGAVPPTQILVGKVVGIGGAGLLQVLVWMLVGFLVSGPR